MASAVAFFFYSDSMSGKTVLILFSIRTGFFFRIATNQIFAELLLKCESHLKGSYFCLTQTEIEREQERERELITT